MLFTKRNKKIFHPPTLTLESINLAINSDESTRANLLEKNCLSWISPFGKWLSSVDIVRLWLWLCLWCHLISFYRSPSNSFVMLRLTTSFIFCLLSVTECMLHFHSFSLLLCAALWIPNSFFMIHFFVDAVHKKYEKRVCERARNCKLNGRFDYEM